MSEASEEGEQEMEEGEYEIDEEDDGYISAGSDDEFVSDDGEDQDVPKAVPI